jgi:ribosomal protein S18 acetylase RimI-like enzyme
MSDPLFSLRKADRADFPAMKAILRATFETTWRPHVTPEAAAHYITTDIDGGLVEQSGTDMIVADLDGTIAGLIYWRDDFIESLHVAPHAHRLGIGAALLAFVEADISRAGFARARLQTDTFNTPAQRFYTSLGYTERDRYPDTEWNSGLTTILFEKSLC